LNNKQKPQKEKKLEPYLAKMMETLSEKGLLGVPGVLRINFSHSVDCPRPSGGQCNCDPEILVENWSTKLFIELER
jgi:hypothetical protein